MHPRLRLSLCASAFVLVCAGFALVQGGGDYAWQPRLVPAGFLPTRPLLTAFDESLIEAVAGNDFLSRWLPVVAGDAGRELQAVRDNLRRSEALGAGWDRMEARVQAKQDVVRRLVDGDISLLQAALRFRELDGGVAMAEELVAQAYPAPSRLESWCRRVLQAVDTELEADPARRGAVLSGLRQQLAAPTASIGGAHLVYPMP